MGIVLASGSPRRRELMQMLGVKNLRIIPAKGEEKFTPGTPPEEIVKELSRAKAEEVAAQCLPEDIIIAADTIVWADSRVFGKPKSREEAAFMLRNLSGRGHTVYTGVTVLHGEVCDSEVEKTEVYFRELGDREIEAYIDSGEPMDKAGAYGAQGLASLFVQGINGDFFNVMGLPVCRLGRMLKKQGVQLI